MPDQKAYVTVAGGATLDISGVPGGRLVPYDSSPGTVSFSPGGVGRNIAHNMSLLGMDVRLITLFGDDPAAAILQKACDEAGVDTSLSGSVGSCSTAVYLYIADEKGEMQLAVNDMGIFRRFTPEFLGPRMESVNAGALCVADANLPAETLRLLADSCTVPLFADPVSTAKAGKLKPILPRIHTLKPNRYEAELLTGIPVTDGKSAAQAAEKLLSLGVRRVFLTLGKDGVLAADADRRILLPADSEGIVGTTGAGDSFMAALAWSAHAGLPLEESARAGLAAAAICLSSRETVCSRLCEAGLRERAQLPANGISSEEHP